MRDWIKQKQRNKTGMTAGRISADLDEGRALGAGLEGPDDVDQSAEVLTMRTVDFRPEEFPEGPYGAPPLGNKGVRVQTHDEEIGEIGSLMETYNFGAFDRDTGTLDDTFPGGADRENPGSRTMLT